jgi:hypothetical protein
VQLEWNGVFTIDDDGRADHCGSRDHDERSSRHDRGEHHDRVRHFLLRSGDCPGASSGRSGR